MFGQGGFSINKLLNRIADKNQLSPPRGATSPDSENPPLGNDEETTAEGFLCPTCMLAFPSPEMLQNHYESSHIEETQEQRGQFICPACKMRLCSDIELQSHYNRHHTENKMRNGDLSSLKQELSELHTSLKEEKWYSEELKKEVLRLQTIITSPSNAGDAPQVENELLRSQNRILEEAKNLATSELVLLRQQLKEKKENSGSVVRDKQVVEQKAAILAGELANMKAKNDEMISEKAALEYRVAVQEEELSRLNSEVQQGSGAEDVQVLKEELASIQKMMDEISQRTQAEKESLEEQLVLLQKKLDELDLANKDLYRQLKNAPTQDEVERLRQTQNASFEGNELNLELKNALNVANAELEALKSQLSEKEAEVLKFSCVQREVAENNSQLNDRLTQLVEKVNALSLEKTQLEQILIQERNEFQQEKLQLKSEMDKFDHSSKVRQSELEEFKQELMTLQTRYQEECALASELKVQIMEKTSKVEQTEEHLQRKLSELKSELQRTKETVERLESERTRLYEQIEQGEGANTAIQQLQDENLGLQEQLEKQLAIFAKHKEDYQLQVENSNSQINDLKGELQNHRDKFQRIDEESKDLKSKLSSLREKSQLLEAELRSKSDIILSTEAAFNIQRAELEQQLRVSLARVDEKEKQVSAKDDKLNQMSLLNSKQNEECVRLATLLKKESEKFNRIEVNSVDLASQLTMKKEQILGLMKDKENLNQTVSHLKSIEVLLSKREEEFVEKNNAWNEIRARLEKQLEERNKEIEKTLENLEKSQLILAERATELNTLLNLKQQLERKLEETSGQLRDQKRDYQDVESKLAEIQLQLLHEQSAREELQRKVDSLVRESEESREEVQQLMAALENLREVKQELSEKILELDRQVRHEEKGKSELEESKKSLEMDLDESKRILGKVQEQATALQKACQLSKQELQDTRELLLAQKAELGRRLESTIEEKDSAIQDQLLKEEAFHHKEEQLEDSIKELQSQLEEQKRSHKDSERQREESESRYQAQLNVLNQNLGTLREDLRGEQSVRENIQEKLEQCSGDKLELEAKLENALDERRGLLDRCLRSEDECEKLRNTTMELRRKLDDSLAALHELGRENQALQIENTKLVNRKWADDSDVTNCMACRKIFTVTIRKHHCRNCGGIYCNECSAKSATIAAFKKPVRVCENCFSEVTKQ